MKYEVTPFVTHIGGSSEFNNLDKVSKELSDVINELRANGHLVLAVVTTETDNYDSQPHTSEDGFLIITAYDPEA